MSKSSNSSGIGTVGLLGVVFVTLKLLGKITWSWWWVTLPFWGSIVLGLLLLLGYVVYLFIKASKKKRQVFNSREVKSPKKKSKFQQRLEDLAAEGASSQLDELE